MDQSRAPMTDRLLGRGPSATIGDDRGRERVRRILLSALVAMVSRAGTLLVLLVTIPMAHDVLGPERFGIWMVLSSLTAISTFADFGIGNGVLTLTAQGHGNDSPETIRRAVTVGLATLGAVALAIVALLLVLHTFVNWGAVFGVQTPAARSQSAPAVLAFGICFALALPTSIVGRVQAGLQSGYLFDLWNGAGSMAAFAGVMIAIAWEASLPTMLLALFGLPAIAQALNSLWFFTRRSDVRPGRKFWHGDTARQMVRLGSMFFVLQLIAVVAFRLDLIIVTRFFGIVAAGQYAVYERLFLMLGMVMALALNPLWPAYAEALQRQDSAWIKRVFQLSIIAVPALTTIAAAVVVVVSPYVGQEWFDVAPVPLALLLGLALWRVLENTGMSVAMFLNGMGLLSLQIASAVALVVLATGMKFALAPRFGPSIIPWATSLVYALVSLAPLLIVIKRRLFGSEHWQPEAGAKG